MNLIALVFALVAQAAPFYWEKKDVPVKIEGGYWVSDWVEVKIPPGLVSFQVVMLGSMDVAYQVGDLIDPSGEAYTVSATGNPPKITAYGMPVQRNITSPNRSEGTALGTGSYQYPNNPDLPAPKPGRWRLRTLSTKEPHDKTVTVIVKGKSKAEPGRVRAKVWAAPDSYWVKKNGQVRQLIKLANQELKSSGIEIDVVEYKYLPDPPSSPVFVPQDISVVAYTNNDPEFVNIYLMPEQEFQGRPVTGYSCFSGPVRMKKKHSCFVGLFAGPKADEYTPLSQARILVHEMGHYLGLFHTRDDGIFGLNYAFDSFDDTSETIVGENMMDSGVHNQQPRFSPQQKKMLLLAPALEPVQPLPAPAKK